MLILRILRDLAHRIPQWAPLIETYKDDWLLELLVDKCFQRNRYECITLKFRTIFEVIAAGLLFMKELGTTVKVTNMTEGVSVTEIDSLVFADPCTESEIKESIFDLLSIQQKEDLTESAQRSLRLIAMNRIHEVLGMEFIKPEPYPKPNANKTEDTTSDQKETEDEDAMQTSMQQEQQQQQDQIQMATEENKAQVAEDASATNFADDMKI